MKRMRSTKATHLKRHAELVLGLGGVLQHALHVLLCALQLLLLLHLALRGKNGAKAHRA